MTPAPTAKGSLLAQQHQEPISIHTIEYDFENYALEHGIPETLDPLPYRKANSVFATGEEAEPVLTSAKHDPRLRTVVCRHWLRDLCMKGSACEFLHQYDLSKMPLCRHGERCKIHDCPFRHISEANRLECVFYSQGFCIHGPFCRYKHVRRDRIDLPAVADFTLGLSQMQAGKDGTGTNQTTTRRPAPKPNEFYKISLCKHFLQGECPFGEGCHFAHGESELRSFPRQNQNNNSNNDNAGEVELSDNMFQNETTTTSTVDYFQGGASGGGKPSPILEPEHAHFFILLASTQADLAISTVRKEWYVQKKHAEQLNQVFEKNNKGGNKKGGSSSTAMDIDGTEHGQVLLFFTVSGSRHIQGAALMVSPAVLDKAASRAGLSKDPFCYRLGVEWYRTTEFPVATALEAAPDLLLPTKTTQYCQDMSSKTGESLMKALWNSPLVTLYEAWSDDYEDDDADGAENGGRGKGIKREPPAPDALLTDFRCPPSGLVSWPVMPGPGFIFGCSSDTMDECLGRGVFGLPAHMKAAAKWLAPGSTVFLFNVTDRLLFGIFEALTPAGMNYEATAFSKNPKATSSPFPVQIRVRVALECPPLEDTDPLLNDILRSRGSGRIGALTFAQTEAIASLLASQCGALQYMLEYQDGLQHRGPQHVHPPPIALPPRKIEKANTGNKDSTV